jgi:hypothetical protein
MTRTDIINHLVKKHSYKTYLEVGLANSDLNFDHVIVELKHSVDPVPDPSIPTFVGTSDDFFRELPETTLYDIIFIDGLHEHLQVYKDIHNALKHLSAGGTIVCHDMSPNTEVMQRSTEGGIGGEWTGDCWKAWAKIRSARADLFMRVVDTDYGCGIIQQGSQKTIPLYIPLDYKLLVDNRKYILNLISKEEFLNE